MGAILAILVHSSMDGGIDISNCLKKLYFLGSILITMFFISLEQILIDKFSNCLFDQIEFKLQQAYIIAVFVVI